MYFTDNKSIMNNNILRRYMCDNSDNLFEFEIINDDTSIMIDSFIDKSNIKLFFLLLKEIIDNLNQSNIKYLQQYVYRSDYESIKHLDWEIINDKDDIIIIQCDINKSLRNIAAGLGFDNI
jgi:hypothetical protein